MNEGTRPQLPPDTAGAARHARGSEGFREADAAAAAAPARQPAHFPDLQACDLVVEMVRTALDDQATTTPPEGGARAGRGAVPPHGPPAPFAAERPEDRRDMSAPLDPGSLMVRQGDDFVRRVYLEVLGREPDGHASSYMEALREGRMSKLEILGAVRFSDEGKAVGREVRGLKPRFLITRAYRLPVVGRLARIGTAVAGLPATLRHLQRLEQSFTAVAARTEALSAAAEDESRDRARGEAEARARVHRLEEALTSTVSEAAAAAATAAQAASRQEDRGKLTDDAVLSLADRLDALEAAVAEAGQRPPAAAGAAEPSLDDLYIAFEDKFRGARELIKERQAVYLPLLEECGAGTLDRPVLDVGCGRGEWLELLRERDLVASGVDLNASMVALCRGMGLEAVAGDAVEHLHAAAPGSLGAVTGFHIIEHLPFGVFVRLLDEALRALASGGAIVFETPNPDNVLVGSRNFYLDPTHRNPMPSDMTVMIAEARGFARAHARPLHPAGQSFNAKDKALGERLDGLFYGPQDYALVAWKP